jgi:hypothetical protein
MHLAALLLALLAQPDLSGSGGLSYTTIWECPPLETISGPTGLPAGYTAAGCGFSGPSQNLLLPGKSLFIPVASADPSISVIAEGVSSQGSADIMASTLMTAGSGFAPADAGDLPGSWGELAGIHVFRGARLAEVRLHPVIRSESGLLRAERLLIRVTEGSATDRAAQTHRPSGAEAELFRLLCGSEASRVRVANSLAPADSPFWGLPWARISVDTAGVYSVRCEDVPGAEGSPSASLAMYCGEGRAMGPVPWAESYVPRPVPILVEDGGDGTFDAGDRILFFGRGLSWWEPEKSPMPSHFMHPAARLNCYWLTWGVGGGSRMAVLDADLTGAPAMPQTTLARFHFEKDFIWKRGLSSLTDWFWDAAYGSGVQWFYHPFDCPGSSGSGTLRLFLKSGDYGEHRIAVTLNTVTLCDTSWQGLDDFVLDLDVANLRQAGNLLGYRITHTSGGDAVYFDRFEVFTWSSLQTRGQTQIPLEWYGGGDNRFRVDWQGSLESCLVFAVSGDDSAAVLSFDDPQSFEVELPSDWGARELWVVPEADLATPVSIEAAQPGRILGTLDGASTVYISAGEFLSDVQPLADAFPGAELVDIQEIYDEFNGGVRDPGAIRAFLSYALASWSPAPLDVVLVGAGHYDPKNNISAIPSYIDALMFDGSETCSDDIYGIVEGSGYPQIALSRIGARQRTDVQLIVQRTLDYVSDAGTGQWQSVVIGAADDERSSKMPDSDETFHTDSMERVLEDHIPHILRPIKHYEIFYPFGDGWRKPEARQDLIDLWSEGALFFLFFGHGGYDQLTDEGLLYLEDMGLLACGPRLPIAFFGSCSVGEFQHPGRDCMAQNIVTSPVGGAIQAIGATWETAGSLNEALMTAFLDDVFASTDLSTAGCLLAAKLQMAYSENDRKYVIFGDGSRRVALPPDEVGMSLEQLRTGEQSDGNGTSPGDGLVLLQAFESCQADTYYTFQHGVPIAYRSPGDLFFSGSCAADPGMSFSMFVPVDADTGSFARVSAFFLGGDASAVGALYPISMIPGSPSPSDTVGPAITLWLEGFRTTPNPVVSGPVTVCAELSDTSGIDLLGNPGRQLALYVDGNPMDVSEYFRFDPGSSTSGSLEVGIGTLPEGSHDLELRASDCLLNRSSEALEFEVSAVSGMDIWQVFVYPCPASGEGLSLNWMQSSEGDVEIEFFTVTGRRIMAFRNIPSEAGYNSLWWDCADADGDPVASGAYVYSLRASSGSGSAEATGILAIVR